MLLSLSEKESKAKARQLLGEVFQTLQFLNPSKNASDYWLKINRTMLSFSSNM